MLKLRILLLHNSLYYFLLGLALINLLFVAFFSNKESVYKNISNLDCIITNIIVKNYGVKLELKGQEKLLGYYYLKKTEIKNFINTYKLGDKISINFKEMRVTNNTVLNTFNYKKYLLNKRIYKVLEITNITKITSNKNVFYRFKQFLLTKSFKLEKSYPYIFSLIFAENNYLKKEAVDSYRSNGISHLFAISGSHISLFILALQWLLKKIRIKENPRYVIMIIFLLFYMFLTNFSISVVRACLFTSLVFLNNIFYFNIDSKNLLLLTLTIILLFNPLNIFDVGLQYSFVISFTLILMKDYVNLKKGYLKKLLTISYFSFIASIPITIYNFYELNFFSIINNLFFVPYVSFIILPLIFVTYLFPFLDKVLFLFLEIMNKFSFFMSEISFLKVIFCKPNLSIIVVYYMSIILYLWGLKKNKKVFIIFLVTLLLLNNIWTLKINNYLTFFDIGQGDSIILSVNDTYSLIDTGGIVMESDSKYTYNLSKNKIIPYLKSLGIKKIDHLFLTHGDVDHMKESLYLIEHFKIKNIYLNSNGYNELEKEVISLANKNKIKIHILKENTYINLNGIKLYSLNEKRTNENDSSLVLYFKINNYKVLLTGDIPKEVEKDLLKKYDLKNLTVLKLAHHGSRTSSDFDFLKETNPKYAIISAGYDNKFNHPSIETINNLNKLKIKYYETTTYGSITFNFKSGTFSFNYP